MKKRLPIAIAALCLIVLGSALALPRTHYAIQGWFRGEDYFAGQPTSYWVGAINKEPFIGDQGDVFKKLGEGGTAAVPVLCQLCMNEDRTISSQADLAVRFMDLERQGMTPTAAEALVSIDSLDLFHLVIGKLSSQNRLALKERLAEELKDKARPRTRAAAALAFTLLARSARGSRGNDNESELLRIAMADGAIPVRVHAAILLSYSKEHTDEVLPALVAGMQNPDAKIRRVASAGLGMIDRSANYAIRSAMIGLLRSKDPGVREDATSMIGAMVPDEEIINALLQSLRDEDALVRYRASLALANQQVRVGKEAIPILLAALQDIRDPRPHATRHFPSGRSNVARILGRLASDNKAILDTLAHTLRNDNDPLVRTAAASALATASPRSWEVVNALSNAIRQDDSASVRMQAASDLQRMGKEAAAALPALIASVVVDNHEAARSSEASAVAEIATDERQVLGLLTALKECQNEWVRVTVAQTLGQLKFHSMEVENSLLHALDDKSDRVRGAAAAALGRPQFRSENVVAGLVRALGDKEVGVQLEAAGALSRVDPGNAAAVRALRQHLKVGTESREANGGLRRRLYTCAGVRQRAIEVLAEYGAAAKLALPELIGLLGDNQSAERLHVIRALAAIGPEAKAALPKIKENLKNPDLFCRVAAAHALWRIDRNAELAIPVLIEAFADQQMDTEWLSEVLGEIGPDAKAAVPRLREIADSAPWAQASVRKALAKITGEAEPKDEPGVRK